MNLASVLATSEVASKMSLWTIIGYLVVIVLFVVFVLILPQKKQAQKQRDMFSNLKTGDGIVTTSGFYGVLLDVVDDTVIVEFGNNKNCRIAMKKEAIAEVESCGTEKSEPEEAPVKENAKERKNKKDKLSK